MPPFLVSALPAVASSLPAVVEAVAANVARTYIAKSTLTIVVGPAVVTGPPGAVLAVVGIAAGVAIYAMTKGIHQFPRRAA